MRKSTREKILIPKSIKIIAKTIQFFSLNLAAKFAIFIFSTPVKYKIPKRELKMFANSKKRLVLIPAISKKVMLYTYGNGLKKALLVHGWSGRGTQLSTIAQYLIENNYTVYSFDAPGHGKSPKSRTNMLEFEASIKFLDLVVGPFDIAIGHSLGGMALLKSSASGFKVNKLIVIGTGDKVTTILLNFIHNLQLKPIIVLKIKHYFDDVLKVNIEQLSGSYNALKTPTKTLVIHDKNDKDIDVSRAYKIRQNLKNGELFITNNLGHRLILRDKKVIDKISTFITT